MKILDIDLDFFLNDKHRGSITNVKRLPDKYFKPWKVNEVENFLENNCGLNKEKKTHGKYFIHHHEVFLYLRKLQEQNNHLLKFCIDHLDAHADLGTGDLSYQYIATTILNKPVIERAYPDKLNGWEGLSSGNFLAFAIACRWVERLNYINNIEWVDDTQWFHFKDFNIKSNIIQFKQFSNSQMDKIINCAIGMKQMTKSITPLSYEPEVPFSVTDFNKFVNKEEYDLIFLTQSPGFTPKKSDELIPVIKQYMKIGDK